MILKMQGRYIKTIFENKYSYKGFFNHEGNSYLFTAEKDKFDVPKADEYIEVSVELGAKAHINKSGNVYYSNNLYLMDLRKLTDVELIEAEVERNPEEVGNVTNSSEEYHN